MTLITLHPHEIAAILVGRQTQLRRPVEPQPPAKYTCLLEPDFYWSPSTSGQGAEQADVMEVGDCPLGRVSSLLHFDEFTLKVLKVRVERVRKIDLDDAEDGGIASEVAPVPTGGLLTWYKDYSDGTFSTLSSVASFKTLWEKLYPAHPWETSWCWVVDIEAVK